MESVVIMNSTKHLSKKIQILYKHLQKIKALH